MHVPTYNKMRNGLPVKKLTDIYTKSQSGIMYYDFNRLLNATTTT